MLNALIDCGDEEHTSPLKWLPKVSQKLRPTRYVGQKELRRRERRGYTKHVVERKRLKALWSFAREFAAAKPETDAFEVRFLELVARWREETKSVSSTTDRALNSAYQDIIGMGERALPLIFREMQQRGGHWFWALRHITHQNPVSPQDAGNIQRMREAWLEWGRQRHYL